jgi:hypothetical protein
LKRRRSSPVRKFQKKKSTPFVHKKKIGTKPEKFITVVKTISKISGPEKIPTSLVSLSPERIIAENQIDVLVGLFHIMWEDMPRPRTYSIRLSDLVSFKGDYVGSSLKHGFSKSDAIDL